MGLTIHWEIEFEGSEGELIKKLDKIYDRVVEYAPMENERVDFDRAECKRRSENRINDDWFWLWIQSNRLVRKENRLIEILPECVYALSVWPMKGCEQANFSFGKFPDVKKWRSQSFCKTCYSENPVLAHVMVCQVLHLFEKEGFAVKVEDEGDFYKPSGVYGQEDFEKLSYRFGSDKKMLAALGGMLKDSMPRDWEISASIFNDPNFEHLEAEGRKEMN